MHVISLVSSFSRVVTHVFTMNETWQIKMVTHKKNKCDSAQKSSVDEDVSHFSHFSINTFPLFSQALFH